MVRGETRAARGALVRLRAALARPAGERAFFALGIDPAARVRRAESIVAPLSPEEYFRVLLELRMAPNRDDYHPFPPRDSATGEPLGALPRLMAARLGLAGFCAARDAHLALENLAVVRLEVRGWT